MTQLFDNEDSGVNLLVEIGICAFN